MKLHKPTPRELLEWVASQVGFDPDKELTREDLERFAETPLGKILPKRKSFGPWEKP